MSSQANRSENSDFFKNDTTFRELQGKVDEIKSEISELYRSLKMDDPLRKFIPLLFKLNEMVLKYSFAFTQKIGNALNKKNDNTREGVKRLTTEIEQLKKIIQELQATIEAAEAMADLSSGSDSRKRPRTLLKL